ncbi:hypothetical protein ACFQY9_32490 [Microvirga aerilata]|uniref:hypothetical protein n=1 Tax=Microvirga aerilata TaxID=670292 RepID=UPI003627D525
MAAALVLLALLSSQAMAQDVRPYEIVGDAIPVPLTGAKGILPAVVPSWWIVREAFACCATPAPFRSSAFKETSPQTWQGWGPAGRKAS